MPFFIRGKNKKQSSKKDSKKGKKIKLESTSAPVNGNDEEIESDDSDVEVHNEYKYSSESEEETAQEKRLRLAKKYLEEIEAEEKKRLERDEIDKEAISHRLKEDVLEQAGRLKKFVADSYTGFGDSVTLKCKDHNRSITCLVISLDNEHLYSASEDCNIVRWSLKNKQKLAVCHRKSKNGHKSKILVIALSSDNKFLASGDVSSVLNIWDPVDFRHIHTFKGHKKAITGLVFRKDSHQLFSCSDDAYIKIWNLDEMSYVETLFGHQYGVTSIDSLSRGRPVTSGGRDNSIMIWKIAEESHLILNGHGESIDCVKLINDESFVSGGEDGSVCLWSSMKKKAVYTMHKAHGTNEINKTSNWIISIAAHLYTDLFATGSWNGEINLYKCSENFKSFTKLFSIPVSGNVNCLSFTSDGLFLMAAVGQDHRLGRWHTIRSCKNVIHVIPLIRK